MLRFFIIAVVMVGLWWWLIGNRIPPETDAPVQWTALAEEAQALGKATDANRCLNESLLKARSCTSDDVACIDNTSLYASACFDAASDTESWCRKITLQPSPIDHRAAAACSAKAIEGTACLTVAKHILLRCQAGVQQG